MYAILNVQIPFSLLVPSGVEFGVHGYTDGRFRVSYLPPARSGGSGQDWSAMVDGTPAYFADVLVIRFDAAEFDRRLEVRDPPVEIMARAVDEIIKRLRYASNSYQVVDTNFPHCSWKLDYYNDDGSQPERMEGIVRGRGCWDSSVHWTLLTAELWERALTVDRDRFPQWRWLLIEAQGALPHVGTAVVLAATALEVLVENCLESLAPSTGVSAALWGWINGRENRQNNPTVEEQFSTLLKLLCGHSLKERADLWEAAKNLRSARNAFVHSGVAEVGRTPVDEDRARAFIASAYLVEAQLRDWLPEELRWPIVQIPNAHVQLVRPIPRAPAGEATQVNAVQYRGVGPPNNGTG